MKPGNCIKTLIFLYLVFIINGIASSQSTCNYIFKKVGREYPFRIWNDTLINEKDAYCLGTKMALGDIEQKRLRYHVYDSPLGSENQGVFCLLTELGITKESHPGDILDKKVNNYVRGYDSIALLYIKSKTDSIRYNQIFGSRHCDIDWNAICQQKVMEFIKRISLNDFTFVNDTLLDLKLRPENLTNDSYVSSFTFWFSDKKNKADKVIISTGDIGSGVTLRLQKPIGRKLYLFVKTKITGLKKEYQNCYCTAGEFSFSYVIPLNVDPK